MSLGHSTSIVRDGLVFYYDMGNIQKSWKGEPTKNWIFFQNPRIDSSYEPFTATESGTWKAKHPDAIKVYSVSNGNNISNYTNTGVTDWTNTYHAIWTFDKVLNKPVVTMRDFDGQWKAKSFGTEQTIASFGLSAGQKYTISWLQWTDNIARGARVGLHGPNGSSVYDFYDGITIGYNTVINTWQKVSATFTVSSSWNVNGGLNLYMYGMGSPAATIKISDVQLETKDHASAFLNGDTRSNTQALVDLTNTYTITASSLTYSSDNTFTFSSLDKLDASLTKTATCSFSIWASTSIAPALQSCMLFNAGPSGSGPDLYFSNNVLSWNVWDGVVNSFGAIPVSSNDGKAHNYTVINDASTGAKLYYDGNLLGTATYRDASSTNTLTIGSAGSSYYWTGTIPIVQVYSKALSATEIKQNFNALRGRFGV